MTSSVPEPTPAAGAESAAALIDTHVHVWDLDGGGPFGVRYPWLGPQLPTLNRSFRLAELAPELTAVGVDGLVLVQAADSEAETAELLRVAAESPVAARVVGWLPLADPDATAVALQRLHSSALVGVRHLIHDEPDPEWLLRPDVRSGMDLIAAAGLVFDAVAERPELLGQLPLLARRHPALTIVLDHLGKPGIATGGWQPWADLMARVAAEPNVVAKISGLGTVSGTDWTAADWHRYVDHALAVFGPDRLMLGGDWPVALQAGSYQRTWAATLDVIDALNPTEQSAVRAGTARRTYRF